MLLLHAVAVQLRLLCSYVLVSMSTGSIAELKRLKASYSSTDTTPVFFKVVLSEGNFMLNRCGHWHNNIVKIQHNRWSLLEHCGLESQGSWIGGKCAWD